MNNPNEMIRQKVGILLGAPTTCWAASSRRDYDVLPLRYFILALNRVQTAYEFSFPDHEPVPTAKECTEEELLQKVESIRGAISPGVDYLIIITTSRISGNLFFTTASPVAAITTDTWEKYFSPPSLFEYLLHCLSACLLFMHPKLHLDSHRDTRGCVLDYTGWKPDDRVDIALGYICDSDRTHIRQRLGDSFLEEMHSVISRKWIGSTNDHGSVAYNLKHYFRFDIDRDSGFNKNFWERAKAKFDEVQARDLKQYCSL